MNDSSESLMGVFLMAHGAPESVDDIPEYLKNIRGLGKPCLTDPNNNLNSQNEL